MRHVSSNPSLMILALIALPVSGLSARAQESIVGTWATPGRCGVPLSTIVVEPMSISGEDFFCDFKSVSRNGDVVNWRGRCTFGDTPETTAVTARLADGRLSYRMNRDGWNGPLQRCPKGAN